MAKAKLTKAERAAWEKDLAILRNAVAECERTLAEDDAAEKAVAAASDSSLVRSIADRDGMAAGILAIRTMGGTSIADTVHGRKGGQ